MGVPGRAPAAAVAGRNGLAEPDPPARPGDPDRGTRRVGAHPPGPRRPQPRPTSLPPPSTASRRPGGDRDHRRSRVPPLGPPDPPSPALWRVVRDVLGRRTEAEIDHGGRTELPDGAVLVERYRGRSGRPWTGPGRPGPAARPSTGSSGRRRPWPPAPGSTCGPTPTPSRSSSTWRPAKATSFAGPAAGTAASPPPGLTRPAPARTTDGYHVTGSDLPGPAYTHRKLPRPEGRPRTAHPAAGPLKD
jgi:hypothetical protein